MAEKVKSPAVSVLMPVYNAQKTVKTAIWSVLNQSFSDFEFLIYLDGCTDDTDFIVSNFINKHIRIIRSEENKGIVAARNVLLAEAKGEFICWIDSDDIWLSDKLGIQYDYIQSIKCKAFTNI